MKLNEAKSKLDRVIQLSRVEMYKPIQVAEILREIKQNPKIDPAKLETYRNISRDLRNRITQQLIGKVSTSSMRFQDDLWNDSAVPPSALEVLEKANRNSSKVEEYIYQHVYSKNAHLIEIRKNLDNIKNIDTIQEIFISFKDPGLRSSADRLYEVFALAVLQTDLEDSDYQLSIKGSKDTLKGLGVAKILHATEDQTYELKLAKMGHTNAADAGLDIWTNFGVVISVKNYHLDIELFEKVLSDTPVGYLIIICETVMSDLLQKHQEISKGRPVVFITKSELFDDAKRILDNQITAKKFIGRFLEFYDGEFPLATTLEEFMKKRKYRIAPPESKPW